MAAGDAYQPVLRPIPVRELRQQSAPDPPFPVMPDGVLIFDDDADTDLCRREHMKRNYDEHSEMPDIEKIMFQ